MGKYFLSLFPFAFLLKQVLTDIIWVIKSNQSVPLQYEDNFPNSVQELQVENC